jgi:predicted DNA-binding WGR domain protein
VSGVRWDRAPRGVRPDGVRVENLALVPASLLPHKAQYQRLANQLPSGAVLVVLPDEDSPERQALHAAAARFLAKGHPVTTVAAAEVLGLVRTRRSPAQPTAVPHAAAAAPAPTPMSDMPPAPPPTDMPAGAATPDAAVVPPFIRELRLVSVDDSRNRARFYVLQWQPTLWGGVALVRLWGRIGSTGRAQVLCYTDTPVVNKTVERVVRRRLRHGYQVVDWH